MNESAVQIMISIALAALCVCLYARLRGWAKKKDLEQLSNTYKNINNERKDISLYRGANAICALFAFAAALSEIAGFNVTCYFLAVTFSVPFVNAILGRPEENISQN